MLPAATLSARSNRDASVSRILPSPRRDSPARSRAPGAGDRRSDPRSLVASLLDEPGSSSLDACQRAIDMLEQPPLAGPQDQVRVLVVDSQEIVHWALRVLLTVEPWVQRCLAASSVSEATSLARHFRPHVALVDLFLGEESGVHLCEQITAAAEDIRVLLMSGSSRMAVTAARGAGASGFVPKRWPAKAIVGAVRMVSLGMTVYPPLHSQPRLMLSRREWDVLQQLACGATNRQIADRLFLSAHTIKCHTRTLYQKLGARNRAEAILLAERTGLVT